jgi:hypothetical protein
MGYCYLPLLPARGKQSQHLQGLVDKSALLEPLALPSGIEPLFSLEKPGTA